MRVRGFGTAILPFVALLCVLAEAFCVGCGGKLQITHINQNGGGPSYISPISFSGLTSIGNVTGSTARLNWTNVPGASTYNIYKVTNGSVVWVASVAAPASSYQVTGLSSGTSYTFRVRMIDTSGLPDANSNDLSITTLSTIATFQGWSNVEALGPEVPSPVATDLSSAPAQVTISWNAVTLNSGSVSSYNVYRATVSGGEDYSNPLATGISASSLSYTDSSPVSGTTYYYTVAPVVSGNVIPVTGTADSEISIVVPPNNMALMHPWIVNEEICGLMGLTSDRSHNYRCAYTGPGNVSGYYEMPTALFVDTYGEGCNYTHGTDCGGADCLGASGSAPANTLGVDGDVYYDRGSGLCYAKISGSWVAANSINYAADLSLLTSNAPGLPPLTNVDQTQAWYACQSQSVSGFSYTKRLLTHREQVEAAAWDPSYTDAQISNLENGSNLTTTHACNSNSGSGLTFDNNITPADLNTLPGTNASGVRSLRLGNTDTTSCVSRYGIQDMVANIWQWSSDQIGSCSSTTHTCQGIASSLDSGNTDWNGLNFDGTIGPGGGGSAVTSWALSTESFSATMFQIPLGVPMVALAPSSWNALAIGTNAGQFDPAKLHGNNFDLQTDLSNDSPIARGAISGGAWTSGSGAGRYTLNLSNTPSTVTSFLGFRCALPAN